MRQQPFSLPYLVSHIPTKSVSPPAQRDSYLKPPTLQPRAHNRTDINNRWYMTTHEDRRIETRSQDRLERVNNSNILPRRDPKPQQAPPPPNDMLYQLQNQIKMLYEENNTLKNEYQKIEKQRNTMQQSYSQLVQMYDQSQREMFSLQQRLQQMAIDCQYNEQYKQKLHEFVEQQKIVIQKLQEERSVPVVNKQQIALELENETLKQELVQLKASLQHLTQYVDVRSRANTRQSESSTLENMEKENAQPFPQQQERLLALSRELLRETQNLKGNDDYELLQKWRRFMMEKYQLESKTPSQPVSDTKQKYKRFNRLVQETAGLLSFRLKPREN